MELQKIYTTRFGGNKVEALKNVNFSVEEGEYVAIMGESGSGKTTLLNILATVDRPTTGEVLLNERDITTIKEGELARFRREHLGFVFQDFNLLDTFIAGRLGIGEILKKYPYEVSGGQKQRAAVARAMITSPDILLADEPTGALDSRSTGDLLTIFERLHDDGQTILMVTHSVRAASHAGRVLFIKDGEVFHQMYKANMNNDEMYKKISDTLTVLLAGGDIHE